MNDKLYYLANEIHKNFNRIDVKSILQNFLLYSLQLIGRAAKQYWSPLYRWVRTHTYIPITLILMRPYKYKIHIHASNLTALWRILVSSNLVLSEVGYISAQPSGTFGNRKTQKIQRTKEQKWIYCLETCISVQKRAAWFWIIRIFAWANIRINQISEKLQYFDT
jgi:hypothetical protein